MYDLHMPSYHPKRCKRCGKHRDFAAISKKGYCPECGDAAMCDANRQIAANAGPVAELRLERWLESFGNAGRPPTPYPPGA